MLDYITNVLLWAEGGLTTTIRCIEMPSKQDLLKFFDGSYYIVEDLLEPEAEPESKPGFLLLSKCDRPDMAGLDLSKPTRRVYPVYRSLPVPPRLRPSARVYIGYHDSKDDNYRFTMTIPTYAGESINCENYRYLASLIPHTVDRDCAVTLSERSPHVSIRMTDFSRSCAILGRLYLAFISKAFAVEPSYHEPEQPI